MPKVLFTVSRMKRVYIVYASNRPPDKKCITKFGLNSPTGSGDSAEMADFSVFKMLRLKIGSRSPNLIKSKPRHNNVSASLILTQVTHVRNKKSNIQRRSLNMIKGIFHTIRNCS